MAVRFIAQNTPVHARFAEFRFPCSRVIKRRGERGEIFHLDNLAEVHSTKSGTQTSYSVDGRLSVIPTALVRRWDPGNHCQGSAVSRALIPSRWDVFLQSSVSFTRRGPFDYPILRAVSGRDDSRPDRNR